MYYSLFISTERWTALCNKGLIAPVRSADLFFLPPIELILTSLRERAKTFFNRFFTSNGKTIKIIYLAISLVYSLCACPGLIKITHTTGKKCRCTWKPSLIRQKQKQKQKQKNRKKLCSWFAFYMGWIRRRKELMMFSFGLRWK